MKFNVPSKELHTQLQAVSKVINTKNALSILDNFLFEVEGNELRITGSDQENIITATIEIMEPEGSGKFALNAKRLLDILKELPPQGLTINVDEDRMEIDISFATGHFSLMGINGNEYPQGEALGDDCIALTIPAAIVQKGIENTIFAVCMDTLRPVMMGIYWDIHPTDITFVSSDTHKLVRYINREMAPGIESSFIMPAKPSGILRGIISKEDTEIKLTIGKKNAVFEVGNYRLSCRFINGNYPNYNRVIPADNPFTISIDRASMLNAMRRVALFASMASGLVKLDISEDNVHLSAQDVDYSVSAEEDITCSYSGNPMTIGFKAAFMIEVLNNLKGETIQVKLSDPTRAGIFVPEEQQPDEDILMILMPMQTFEY